MIKNKEIINYPKVNLYKVKIIITKLKQIRHQRIHSYYKVMHIQ